MLKSEQIIHYAAGPGLVRELESGMLAARFAQLIFRCSRVELGAIGWSAAERCLETAERETEMQTPLPGESRGPCEEGMLLFATSYHTFLIAHCLEVPCAHQGLAQCVSGRSPQRRGARIRDGCAV